MTTSRIERASRLAKTSAAFVKNVVQRRVNKEHYILSDKTVNEVILRDGIMSVKHYKPLQGPTVELEGGQTFYVRKRRFLIPLVMVPPLGVFGWIFDLLADRSLVRYFLAHGFEVYLIDWGKPGPEDSGLSLETYTVDWFPKALKAIREHSGSEELSLLGYCMGGLLSLLYLGVSKDDKVANLITIASPIDTYKANAFAGPVARALSWPASLVKKAGFQLDSLSDQSFHVPGKTLSILFKMTNPLGVVSSYVELIRNMADDDYVARYMTMNEWFTNMPDYPGATVQEMTRKMGLYNRFAKGKFRIGANHVADLSAVNCNLLAFAGDNDKIVSIAGARAILSVVSSADKAFHIVPGGHAGVFTGSKAVHTTWNISKDWLQLRSKSFPRLVDEPASKAKVS